MSSSSSSDSENSEDNELKINKEYALKYNKTQANIAKSRESNYIQKKADQLLKEELSQQFNLEHGLIDDSDSEIEDEDGLLLTAEVDHEINKMLTNIKKGKKQVDQFPQHIIPNLEDNFKN